MTMAKTTVQPELWREIGRGLAGWHASKADVSSSGGQLDPYTYWTGEKCAGYLANAAEGCFVHDVEGRVDAAAFSHLVIVGPMLSHRLDPWQFRDLGEPREVATPRHSITLDQLKVENPDIHSLSQVGIGIFAALQRGIGARCGWVRDGAIVWESA